VSTLGTDSATATASAELRFAPLLDQAAALRDGSTTSLALVTEVQAAADRLDPEIGTYVVRFDHQARQAAAAADEARARGDDAGMLHGIPFGVKDILASREGPTTAQSAALDPGWGDQPEGPVVSRLRAAGAIPLGKTTTMEFAVGYPDRDHHRWADDGSDGDHRFPLPRNPWNRGHWAGGSSSGTGSGVAAGLFPMGLGTDTGGSIRIPAAFCGVSGHKPTFGLVPKSGCVPLGFSYDHIGPLARSVADCAAVLDVIAGPDPSDPTSRPRPGGPERYLDGLARGIDGLRVGVARSATVDGPWCDAEVAACFDEALGALEAAGARLTEVELPYWDELHDATFLGLQAEAFAWHRDTLQRRWEDYGRPTRLSLALGALISGGDFAQAQRVRRVGRRQVGELFGSLDVIVTPTCGTVAPPFGGGGPDRTRQLRSIFTAVFNALGFPALAVPMGLDASLGLPTSLQIVAAPFEDGMALRVGHGYQQVTDWHRRVPPLALG
jgi:Asp-tRNA(Asn)/Glu-tRNA(Gln) amidotransferase A subunit family amidase